MFDNANADGWLAGLNDEQRAAATYAGGPLLILAGAGTGKTTTLCARVAWLLAEGASAERILLLTFTRRAAREMVERARTLAERVAPHAGAVVGGTLEPSSHCHLVHGGGVEEGVFGLWDEYSWAFSASVAYVDGLQLPALDTLQHC
ncbi:MAG: UvrD-helicase domain-containing protein, partial [Solirubrobacteraceae bacterium]